MFSLLAVLLVLDAAAGNAIDDVVKKADGGSWDLALTINPSDGHLVNYKNSAFWAHPAQLGGASFKSSERYTKDYKNLKAFNSGAARLLIVVHQKGKVKGWRSWNLAKPGASLGSYFDSSTTPHKSRVHKHTDFTAGVRMTSSHLSVSPHDPIIRGKYDLYVDSDMDGNVDFSRIAAKPKGDYRKGDRAYGLGGCYDCSHGGRPECDANFVPGPTWGKSSGQAGPMGTDCVDTKCKYCRMSGETYSYAIFVDDASHLIKKLASQVATIDGGQWQLALHVNPSDGHLVNYQNAHFWSSPSSLGGASDKPQDRFTKDYKNLKAFNKPSSKLMIIVHQGGLIKGWRSWNLAKSGKSLESYFDGSKTPHKNRVGKFTVLTKSVRATAKVMSISANDPIIRGSMNLYADSDMDGNVDFSRIAAKPKGDHKQGDRAYGLGGCYDCSHGDRPECDANFVPGPTWGKKGGQAGPMGTDCTKLNCKYCVPSGESYSYAIFVDGKPAGKTTTPKPKPYVKPKLPSKDFSGVRLQRDKSWITFGAKDDITLWRDNSGGLRIAAPSVDFVSGAVTINGKALGVGSGSNLQAMIDKAVEKSLKSGSSSVLQAIIKAAVDKALKEKKCKCEG